MEVATETKFRTKVA